MTERMSAANYKALVASQQGVARSGGRMLRLPADFVAPPRATRAVAMVEVAAQQQALESPRQKRISSAQKARESVARVVDALEGARTEVSFARNEDGSERVLIRVVGGETLPPNRAANIGREQSKLSQRAFSRYKHACADRMRDAAMQLQQQVIATGLRRFNVDLSRVRVCYGRQVTSRQRLIDEDAVAYSFKYLLDGLVKAGLLVDDSKRYVRMGEHVQQQGAESMLLIELQTTEESS